MSLMGCVTRVEKLVQWIMKLRDLVKSKSHIYVESKILHLEKKFFFILLLTNIINSSLDGCLLEFAS